MKSPNQITISEWQEAIGSVSHYTKPPMGSMTSRELADKLGIGLTSAKERLRSLVKAGKAERTMCVIGSAIVPHYVLKRPLSTK